MKKLHIDHRNARKIMWILYGVGVLVMLFGLINSFLIFLGAVIMVAGLIEVLLFWRCPYCGAMLPTREGNIQYCPYCGKSVK